VTFDLGGDASDRARASWLVVSPMNQGPTIMRVCVEPIRKPRVVLNGLERRRLRQTEGCVPNPIGIPSLSPGLSREAGSYPGSIVRGISNPNGVVSSASRRFATTPLGLHHQSNRPPRVVAPLQPWAESRSPFGADSVAALYFVSNPCETMNSSTQAELILHNGRITTLDPEHPEATNLAVKDGRIVGVDDAEEYERGPNIKVIDLKGRRVIPGLNDSHLHVIRGGLNYNMELRWDGVPSLADALRMLKQQTQRTPPGQWVRVVGGWSEFQFAERRMPALDEINDAAPDT